MNWVQVRLFSARSGFVLSDALVAVLVLSVLSVLACSAVNEIRLADENIAAAYHESDEQYTETVRSIGECICEEELSEEEPADTLSSSF